MLGVKIFSKSFFQLATMVLLFSCFKREPNDVYTIGFSQCIEDDWRMNMLQEMQRELILYDHLHLLYRNAGAQNEIQINQIEELIDLDVDILIISPNEAKAITPVVKKAISKGIPVILLDRNILTDDYTTYIGANNYKIGQEVGHYIKSLLDNKGYVIEAVENQEITAFSDRSAGFRSIINEYPLIHLDTVKAMSLGSIDLKLMVSEKFPDVVFAPTDVAAKYAYDVVDTFYNSNNIRFVGIDGLPTKGGGIELVKNGILTATFLYPTGGSLAIKIASDILKGKEVDKYYELETIVIDSSNVNAIRLQNKRLQEQHESLMALGNKIDVLYGVFQNQRILTFLFAALFIFSMFTLAGVIYVLIERKKIYLELKEKNERILHLAEDAEKANQDRVNFFTNISHEFKTPLTLILSPLQDLLKKSEASPFKSDLQLIEKNANRLLSLINQIMDVRKIESGKMKLQVSELDLVLFCREVLSAFRKAVEFKKIDLFFHSQEQEIKLFFDPSMMDKILFNLLSNALKYTDRNGKIDLKIESNVLAGEVKLIIEDTGIGMSESDINHVFDRFYQGDQRRELGTGIGMSLVKELVELHNGKIKLTSKLGKGTRFEINFKMGSEHFNQDEVINIKENNLVHEELFHTSESFTYEENLVEKPKDLSILIIEDNEELRSYLQKQLSKTYEVLESKNVSEGIKIASDNIPDLIISDLMLGSELGYEVIKKLKEDLRTSHIPIIILSAKSSIEEKIKGIQLGADDYITKPFNYSLLAERIKTLLVNRQKLRDHYIAELPVEHPTINASKIDKKFINHFIAIVEQHYSDPLFGVNNICEEMGLSRVQLYRKVKALLDYSVNDYINTVRLKKAKMLISQGTLTFSEIAYQVGYSSSAYFSTAFKNHFGVTPSEYKET